MCCTIGALAFERNVKIFVPFTSLSSMSLRNGGNFGAFGINFALFEVGSTGVPVTLIVKRVSGLAVARSNGSTSFWTITPQPAGVAQGVVGALTDRKSVV